MGMTYTFRREDNDELLEVDFATMMEMDSLGCIKLPDGAIARRVRDGSGTRKAKVELRDTDTPVVSDTLGFPASQLPEFRQQLEKSGCRGIEFTPDPVSPWHMQVRAGSRRELVAYAKSRGEVNRTKRSGGAEICPAQLERAIERAKNSAAAC